MQENKHIWWDMDMGREGMDIRGSPVLKLWDRGAWKRVDRKSINMRRRGLHHTHVGGG